MIHAAGFVKGQVRRDIRQTFRPGTGQYAKSIGIKVEGKGDLLEGRIFIRKLGFYGIHETGGIIKPKRFSDIQKTRRSRKGLSPRTEHKYLTFRTPFGWARLLEARIPARPVFGPAASESADRAADILGNAFRPFLEVRSA